MGAVDGVERVLAGFAYEGAARSLVGRASASAGMWGALVEGMARVVYRRGLLGSLVTWVPGRRKDILDRGFDHAALLARGVSKKLGPSSEAFSYVPVEHLTRRTSAEPSASRTWRGSPLPARLRKGGLDRRSGTTGATAGACARALLIAGASSVEVLTAAGPNHPSWVQGATEAVLEVIRSVLGMIAYAILSSLPHRLV